MNRRDLRRQLIDAIAGGDLPRVAEIAALEPSIVNAPNSHQNVPLGDAIATGRADLVELLIAHGADPHHCNHGGHSMLDEAAFSGRVEIARLLILLGVEPTVHHAAAIGEISLLQRMVTADPTCLGVTNAGGRWRFTPLHAAVRAGNLEAVRYLLSIDAPIDAQDHNGHTALAMITECQSKERRLPIAGLLLSHGAHVDTLAGHHGGAVLHRAVMDGDHPSHDSSSTAELIQTVRTGPARRRSTTP